MTSSTTLTDAAGNVWAITPAGQIAVTSVSTTRDATTADVVQVIEVGGLVYQQNSAGDWWSKASPSAPWIAATDPVAPSLKVTDTAGNVWSVAAGQITVTASTTTVDGTTSGVIQIVEDGGLVYQENADGGWWSKASPSAPWIPTAAPASVVAIIPPASPPAPVPAANFSVKGGQIIDPLGNLWLSKGINLGPNLLSGGITAGILRALFGPGINQVRIGISSSAIGQPGAVYPDPASFAAGVAALTASRIVVLFEDHDGSGGAQNGPYQGAGLTAQTDWYTALAKEYAANPYVWFGTQNEMDSTDGSYSVAAISGMVTGSIAPIYAAIRVAGGNGSIIQVGAGVGGSNPGTIGAACYDAAALSAIGGMTNIAFELHCYYSNGDTVTANGGAVTVATTAAALVNGGVSLPGMTGGWGVAAAQTVLSKDGVVPVIIGEWGDDAGDDTTGASELAAAITAAKVGWIAWDFNGEAQSAGDGDWQLAYGKPPYALTTWGGVVAGIM